MKRAAALILASTFGLVACVSDARPESCADPSVSIELTLTASSLTPSDPGVCRDQEVTLVFDSAVDGFIHIHGYDEAVDVTEVAAGEEFRLTFDAVRSGQFPIEIHAADDPQGVEVGIFTVYEP
jgi:hypothetical protein